MVLDNQTKHNIMNIILMIPEINEIPPHTYIGWLLALIGIISMLVYIIFKVIKNEKRNRKFRSVKLKNKTVGISVPSKAIYGEVCEDNGDECIVKVKVKRHLIFQPSGRP